MDLDHDDEALDNDPEEVNLAGLRLGLVPIWLRPDGTTVSEADTFVNIDSELDDELCHELARSAIWISSPEDLDGQRLERLRARFEAEQPASFRRSGWLREIHPVRLVDDRCELTDPPVTFDYHPVFGFRFIDESEDV